MSQDKLQRYKDRVRVHHNHALVILNVSFSEKDEVKKHGAMWDSENKHWYVTHEFLKRKPAKIASLMRFLPPDFRAADLGLSSKEANRVAKLSKNKPLKVHKKHWVTVGKDYVPDLTGCPW